MNSLGWIDEALTAQIPCAVTNDDNPHAGSVTPPLMCKHPLYWYHYIYTVTSITNS